MIKNKVVIIGAGIAGCTAAIYLKRANKDFVLIDANDVGGKLNSIKEIENYPARANVSGKEIADSLKEQLNNLDIEVKKANVQTLLKTESGFEVITDAFKVECEKVILASGGGDFSPSIKGEDKYLGSGVSYCAVCDGNFFKGLPVAVLGNGSDTINEAIYLASLASKVYFISPSSLIGEKEAINKLNELANVEIIENESVTEIAGDLMGVTAIKLNNKEIEVSGVFPLIGKKSTSQILSNLKPAMNGNFIITDENMESNIKGLFAIGDLRDKKLRQLVTASNDGAIAATKISME